MPEFASRFLLLYIKTALDPHTAIQQRHAEPELFHQNETTKVLPSSPKMLWRGRKTMNEAAQEFTRMNTKRTILVHKSWGWQVPTACDITFVMGFHKHSLVCVVVLLQIRPILQHERPVCTTKRDLKIHWSHDENGAYPMTTMQTKIRWGGNNEIRAISHYWSRRYLTVYTEAGNRPSSCNQTLPPCAIVTKLEFPKNTNGRVVTQSVDNL